jgi:hypothetical protein
MGHRWRFGCGCVARLHVCLKVLCLVSCLQERANLLNIFLMKGVTGWQGSCLQFSDPLDSCLAPSC